MEFIKKNTGDSELVFLDEAVSIFEHNNPLPIHSLIVDNITNPHKRILENEDTVNMILPCPNGEQITCVFNIRRSAGASLFSILSTIAKLYENFEEKKGYKYKNIVIRDLLYDWSKKEISVILDKN